MFWNCEKRLLTSAFWILYLFGKKLSFAYDASVIAYFSWNFSIQLTFVNRFSRDSFRWVLFDENRMLKSLVGKMKNQSLLHLFPYNSLRPNRSILTCFPHLFILLKKKKKNCTVFNSRCTHFQLWDKNLFKNREGRERKRKNKKGINRTLFTSPPVITWAAENLFLDGISFSEASWVSAMIVSSFVVFVV